MCGARAAGGRIGVKLRETNDALDHLYARQRPVLNSVAEPIRFFKLKGVIIISSAPFW